MNRPKSETYQQGVAGSLIGALNLYGISLGLGFVATVKSQVGKDSGNTVLVYISALIFEIGYCGSGTAS